MNFLKKDSLYSIGLLGIPLVLFSLGLVVLSSASQSFIGENYFLKQILAFFLAVFFGTLAFFLNWEYLRRWSLLFLICSFALLLIVFIPGVGLKINGARRWFSLGLFNVQISEMAKLALVFFLADYFDKRQRQLSDLRVSFFIPMGIVAAFCGVVFVEPDFGTAFLLGLTGFSMIFIMGIPWRYLIGTIGLGGGVFVLGVYLDPIRFNRILAFLDVEGNKFTTSYQLWQSFLGFAAGGPWGVGLGNGRQQLHFLPEAHTDFIFPILSEELGGWIALIVVVLFAIFFLIGIIRLFRPKLFYFLFGFGLLLMMTFQALINFAVVTGIVPTKGMALPFISYGGSNLMSVCIALGILLSILKHAR
ncbi:MAG: hypothetical protein A2Y14_01335 [Verrucomicrobia bacterium GWF2_51_19]|nr:MAG: hypothetical protein A2Y14_01335 [Verrucomicrobia bacterium GWF2_51_19]HCJ11718.1 cell cycle protein [Opitutae bacterium]